MRQPLPTINSSLQGIGSAPWNYIRIGESQNWVLDPDELWNEGIRRVRLGGTDPFYVNATQAGKDYAILMKQRGMYVEFGLTFVNKGGTEEDPLAGKFGVEDMDGYLEDCLEMTQWCIDNNMDAVMINNEMSALIDTRTLSVADFELWIRDVVGPACRELIEDAEVEMEITINETANRISAWAVLGRGSANIKRGFNIYGGSASDLPGFKTQANNIKAMGDDAYISEWSIYFTWHLGTFDPELQRKYTEERKAYLNSIGIEHYYFTYKRTNTNDPGDWNAFGAKFTIGTPNNPSNEFLKRKLYSALFPGRTPVGGKVRKWLNFNGTSAYSECPIIPSGAGILIMFWLNRQEYASSEKYVIGNSVPSHGFLQSFRLFHDAPTSPHPEYNRRVALNTFNESASGGFNVINALSGGDDQQIAIYITPGSSKALLYINNRETGSKPSGYMGSPIDPIVIGARAGDFFGKAKMRIRGLVIKNSPSTDKEAIEEIIAAHYNNPDNPSISAPLGASFYDFDLSDTEDQSGNGKHLVNTNTTLYLEKIPGPRPVSGERTLSGQRTEVA